MTVTLFKTLFEKQPKYYDAHVILETFRKGPTCLPLINQIRFTTDKDKRNELKKELPVVLFSGEFSERKAAALKKYSKLIVLDFDDCNVKKKRDELLLLPYIYAVWLSPGGDGLKALVKVSSDNHDGHLKALFKEIKGADQSGKDISRACFISYDPTLYINESADVYTKVVEQAFSDEQKLEKLKKWLDNKGEAFVSGSRNNFLAKLAGACNHFGISREFIEVALVKEYCSTEFNEKEALQVINSVYTNYLAEHGRVKFDDVFSKDEIKDILSTELPASDIILATDIKEDLMKDFDEGVKMGEETYFPVLDEHFRWAQGEVTVMTGVPNGGKSTILQQLALFKAVFDKVKWAVLSMEQFPPTFFYRELIRALIGKPIEIGNSSRMTRKEYGDALEFVSQFFYFIYPEKSDPTPEWTLARFVEAQIKYGCKGCIIDTHGSQDHDKRKSGGRDDQYISAMINQYKRHALQNSLYFVDVAHSKNIGKDDEGCFKEPAADDINGGLSWFARTDNMLVYHRPGMPIIQSDRCTLRSVKIKKQQICGKPGLTEFNYRLDTGRYYEGGYNPLEGFTL